MRRPRSLLVLTLLLLGGGALAGEHSAAPAPKLLGPRSPAARARVLAREGGTKQSEAAVEAALDWLARHQDQDGGWDADGFSRHCEKGGPPCTGIGKGQHGEAVPCPFDDAISALATLAFLGHGHRPDDAKDPRAPAVRKALASVGNPRDRWALALSTQAYSEAAAMTADPVLVKKARSLAATLLALRQKDGGFGYAAPWRKGSDLPYTALAVQALVAARDAGFDLPAGFAKGVGKFLDSLEEKHGKLAYLVDGRKWGYTPTSSNGCAAAAIRELLEVGVHSARQHAHLKLVMREKPVWKISFKELDVPGRGKMKVQIGNLSLYRWWYAGIAEFQHGGSDWKAWFKSARTALVGHQRKKGCRRGSWDPLGTYERQTGGRVFATALGALILEQPYRQRRL